MVSVKPFVRVRSYYVTLRRSLDLSHLAFVSNDNDDDDDADGDDRSLFLVSR